MHLPELGSTVGSPPEVWTGQSEERFSKIALKTELQSWQLYTYFLSTWVHRESVLHTWGIICGRDFWICRQRES